MPKFTKRFFIKIDMIFVLTALALFAVTSLCLSLIGAEQYRYVTDAMNTNYEERTVSSYLTEKIRQYDCQDSISIADLDGTKALAFLSAENDISYTTYIYYYEGALRELLVTDSSIYSPSSGQEILTLHGFEPEFVNDSLIQATVIDTKDNQKELYFSIHSAQGKEKK